MVPVFAVVLLVASAAVYDLVDVAEEHEAPLVRLPDTGYVLSGDELLWIEGGQCSLGGQPLLGCNNGVLEHLDAEIMLVCTWGSDGSFQIRSAEGQLRYDIPLSPIFREQFGVRDPLVGCHGTAYADGYVVVPAFATVDWSDHMFHRILFVEVETGEVEWSRTINVGALAAEATGLSGSSVSGATGISGTDGSSSFLPLAASIGDGTVVVGKFRMGGSTFSAFAWISEEGVVRGARVLDRLEISGLRATVEGGQHMLNLGDRLVEIDPTSSSVMREVVLPVKSGTMGARLGTEPLVKASGLVLVQITNGIMALDDLTWQPVWSWQGEPNWDVVDIVGYQGEAWVALSQPESDVVDFIRLDLREGRVLSSVKVPLAESPVRYEVDSVALDGVGAGPVQSSRWYPGIEVFPTGDGAWLVGARHHARLTWTERAPLAPSNSFPSRGEAVQLEFRHDGPVTVAWGDSHIEHLPAAERGIFRRDEATLRTVTHRYDVDGTAGGTVTLYHANNQTTSYPFAVEVGGTPPPSLNFIQQQFAPENQDRTWGVLGIAVALAGGLYALYARMLRTRRIRGALLLMDELEERSIGQPEDALRELAAVRASLRDQLVQGRLDESQYHLLLARAADTGRRIHRRLVGPIASSLSPMFHRELEAAFSDGIVTRHEAEGLLEMLAREDVEAPARRRLANIINGWP